MEALLLQKVDDGQRAVQPNYDWRRPQSLRFVETEGDMTRPAHYGGMWTFDWTDCFLKGGGFSSAGFVDVGKRKKKSANQTQLGGPRADISL